MPSSISKATIDKILAFTHAKANYSRFVSLLICKVRKRKLWFVTLPKSYLTLLQFSVVSLHFLGEELLGICQVVFARGRERERERDESNPILISEILSRGTFWNHFASDVEMMGPWKEWMGSFAP